MQTAEISTSNVGHPGAAPAQIGQPPVLSYSAMLAAARREEAEQFARAQIESRAAQAAVAQRRVAAVAQVKSEMDVLRHEWQGHRAVLRGVFAQLVTLEEQLSTITGGQVQYLPVSIRKSNIPSAWPKPDAALHPVFSTAEMDMQDWAATGRKHWPLKD